MDRTYSFDHYRPLASADEAVKAYGSDPDAAESGAHGDGYLAAIACGFDHLPQMVVVVRRSSCDGYVNARWVDHIGLTSCESGWNNWSQFVHPADQPAILSAFSAHPRAAPLECRIRHRDGSYNWFLASVQCVEFGGAVYDQVVFTDIDDQVAMRTRILADAAQRDHMLDASMDCIKIINLDGSLRHMNLSGCIALGVPVDETEFGMDWSALLPADLRSRSRAAVKSAARGQTVRFSGTTQLAGEAEQHWDNLLTPLKDEAGKPTAILCVSRDVTIQQEAEDRLRELGEIDSLTGLLNRRAFYNRLKRVLRKARGQASNVGMILIDLDHFKHVNDTIGHGAGDHLLRVFSRRMVRSVIAARTGNQPIYFARLGGDEFAILLENVSSVAEMTALATVAKQQMQAPILHSGGSVNGDLSAGCALYPRDAANASDLMRCADTALNDMKLTGRGGVRVFNVHMAHAAETVARQLRRARNLVADDLIEPYYQPQLQLDGLTICGFEALLRWRDGAGRIQGPAAITEAFRNFELATQVGGRMQERVFADIASWRARGLAVQPIAINVAPVEFLADDFAESFLARLRHYAIPHNLIEVEVTEHALVERGAEHVIRALKKFKAAGIRIMLDDFGVGQSALVHLTDYPVDGIKIDRSFIKEMTQGGPHHAIVKTLVELGPALSLSVIAEGIEGSDQLAALRRIGCHVGQGFLFDPALEPEKAIQSLGQVYSG
ncbi:EAL domain-containing protein [Altererythrobacter xixiisoli]|uniref:EAL domain-containing protein n=1 Tax=Croceibacterium xixiisoli TaxID=1476466 RepID=A0A6I4U0J8_9SPHN|nr:EAL domain-containing protein [Croceibacterium xixiisoli]MXP00174.1 EAL domain-containing protein [Croceibacterium xixiisoli]